MSSFGNSKKGIGTAPTDPDNECLSSAAIIETLRAVCSMQPNPRAQFFILKILE